MNRVAIRSLSYIDNSLPFEFRVLIELEANSAFFVSAFICDANLIKNLKAPLNADFLGQLTSYSFDLRLKSLWFELTEVALGHVQRLIGD